MRLEPWQFRVLFVVAVGGTVVMLFLPNVAPAAAAGIGGMLTFVLTTLKPDRHDDDA